MAFIGYLDAVASWTSIFRIACERGHFGLLRQVSGVFILFELKWTRRSVVSMRAGNAVEPTRADTVNWRRVAMYRGFTA